MLSLQSSNTSNMDAGFHVKTKQNHLKFYKGCYIPFLCSLNLWNAVIQLQKLKNSVSHYNTDKCASGEYTEEKSRQCIILYPVFVSYAYSLD